MNATSCLHRGLVIVLVTLPFMCLDCKQRDVVRTTEGAASNPESNDAMNSRINGLYKIYLNSSRPESRRAIESIIADAEKSQLESNVKAHLLWLAFARLYVIDATLDPEKCPIDLVKIRYWYVCDLEFHQYTATQIEDKISYATEHIFEIVDKCDASSRKELGSK